MCLILKVWRCINLVYLFLKYQSCPKHMPQRSKTRLSNGDITSSVSHTFKANDTYAYFINLWESFIFVIVFIYIWFAQPAWHGGRIQRAKCWTKHMCSSGSWFNKNILSSWWRHQMETFSALLALCAGNSPATGEFPAQRPGTRSFDVFFDLRPNERLSKQSWGWWFETPSRPLLPHRIVSSVGITEIRRLNDRKHIEKIQCIQLFHDLTLNNAKWVIRPIWWW